jgi:hypothetical protein
MVEQICEDLKEVVTEAKRMGCKTADFRDVPIENIEIIISALEIKLRNDLNEVSDEQTKL